MDFYSVMAALAASAVYGLVIMLKGVVSLMALAKKHNLPFSIVFVIQYAKINDIVLKPKEILPNIILCYTVSFLWYFILSLPASLLLSYFIM